MATLLSFKKVTINQVDFLLHKSNLNGFELVSCYPAPDNIVDDVLIGKYANVGLMPGQPLSELSIGKKLFIGLYYEDYEQYEKACQYYREKIIERRIESEIRYWYRSPNFDIAEIEKCIRKNYKDWWK